MTSEEDYTHTKMKILTDHITKYFQIQTKKAVKLISFQTTMES